MPSGFYSDDSKKSVAAAVRAAEAKTAAEFVVALRHASGSYRDADYLAGFVAAIVLLCALLFLPQEFTTDFWPVALVAAFLAGAGLAAIVPPLRRLLTRDSRRRSQVRAAARAAFYDLGVGRTRARTGVLVFLSLFEKTVEIVPDDGLRLASAGEAGTKAIATLQASVAANDVGAFCHALESLGAAMGEFLPHSADDVDELPDTPDAA